MIELRTPFGNSNIYFGRSLSNILAVEERDAVIVTDQHLAQLFSDELTNRRVIVIPEGESAKILFHLEKAAKQLMDIGLSRKGLLVGLGGGAVCDFTGFLASIYKRGIAFGFVPTTLLAQVDAAIGGKNGVNVDDYKNMLGVFSAPEFVAINASYTLTQDEAHWKEGFAEIIKHAFIADNALYHYINKHRGQLLSRELDVLQACIRSAAIVKINIVSEDPYERDSRKKLNFGHTVGHALEKVGDLSHGHAVSIGMVCEARLSEEKTTFGEVECQALIDQLSYFGLPVDLDITIEELKDAMYKDKKGQGNYIDIPILKHIGVSEVHHFSYLELFTRLESL